MAFQNIDVGTLDVFSSVVGSAVNIPKGFWKPGFAAIYNGYFGTSALLNYGQGTLNVGMSADSPFAYTGAPGNVNLHNTSLTTYLGDHRVVGRSSVSGIQFRSSTISTEIYGASNIIAGKNVDIVGSSTIISGASVIIESPSLRVGGREWYSATASWDAKKSFDIPHPTKESHRLRYVCLEGPDADVYIKGKLEGNNIINLPPYWAKLVDSETINVTLTPIGTYQELFVEEIQWGTRVIVKNNNGGTINCYYKIIAERKDVERNIPEYKGLTPMDYPGDNSNSIINGMRFV